MKYSFLNDYGEGAHPNILHKLTATNTSQQSGYGEDEYCEAAATLLKSEIQNPDARVFFVSGGTQANLLVISSLLRPHEAVISAESGHITGHEAGAIQSTGHKIITVPSENGKLTPEHLQSILQTYTLRPHVVKPRLVYISNATEFGTIYTQEELQELYFYCQESHLLLFMDGARLGVALTAEPNDLTLPKISRNTDVFYLGGTKNGALLGESIIFNHPQLAEDFDYHIKQKGALLAKGRVLGIQFLELFQNNLFFELAQQANQRAQLLAAHLKDLGYSFLLDSPTNQIFPIFLKKDINKLHQDYAFHEWKEIDETHSAVRLVTSWTTPEKALHEFIQAVKKLS